MQLLFTSHNKSLHTLSRGWRGSCKLLCVDKLLGCVWWCDWDLREIVGNYISISISLDNCTVWRKDKVCHAGQLLDLVKISLGEGLAIHEVLEVGFELLDWGVGLCWQTQRQCRHGHRGCIWGQGICLNFRGSAWSQWVDISCHYLARS